MTSILTNTSAINALSVLRSTNRQMEVSQNAIITGKKVNTARDNPAVWAISKSIRSDLVGFQSVSESLGMAMSTVAVARNGGEKITELLMSAKDVFVRAKAPGADHTKLQTELSEINDQINTIAEASSFSGVNLLENSDDVVGFAASLNETGLDRIDVRKRDMTVGSFYTNNLPIDPIGVRAGTIAPGESAVISNFSGEVEAGRLIFIQQRWITGIPTATAGNYSPNENDTWGDVSLQLAAAANWRVGRFDTGLHFFRQGDQVAVRNDNDFAIAINSANIVEMSRGVDSRGGFSAFTLLDAAEQWGLDNEGSVDGALKAIDQLIEYSTNTTAYFGAVEDRMDIQSRFLESHMTELRKGIGVLVDADLEEESARIQALKVEQELATLSLSIANEEPRRILSLFRNDRMGG